MSCKTASQSLIVTEHSGRVNALSWSKERKLTKMICKSSKEVSKWRLNSYIGASNRIGTNRSTSKHSYKKCLRPSTKHRSVKSSQLIKFSSKNKARRSNAWSQNWHLWASLHTKAAKCRVMSANLWNCSNSYKWCKQSYKWKRSIASIKFKSIRNRSRGKKSSSGAIRWRRTVNLRRWNRKKLAFTFR